jgi:hypothetical protein
MYKSIRDAAKDLISFFTLNATLVEVQVINQA